MKQYYYFSVAVWLTCLAAGSQANAQFNDSIHHNIGYIATGIFNQTNDGNSFLLNNAAKFNVNRQKRFLNSAASWVYGKQNGALTNNDVFASADFDIYGRLPRLYYWGLVTYDKSYSLKVNDRFQGGAGLGYDIARKKDLVVVMSDGILYEYSDLDAAAGNHDRYNTIRNSLRLKYHFVISKIIVLDGVHFWQQSLSSWDDYILKSNSSLSVKLKKWLSITSALSYNKVNRTNSKNLLFTFGFTADYYFK